MSTNNGTPTLEEILADPVVQQIERDLDAQMGAHTKVREGERQFEAAVNKAAQAGGAVLVIPVTPYCH